MPRPLFEDPYAAQAISLLQDPARARADAVRQIADAQARATTAAGNAQAGAQVAGGQAWAGAAQQIGQSVGQIPNDILKAQQQSQQLAMQKLQQQNITSEINQRDQKMRQDAELRATQQNIGRMMASPDVFDQETGLLNAKSIASKLSAQNANYNGPTEPPDMAKIYGLIDPINESLTKAADAKRVAGEHTTNALAHIASTSLTIGKDNGGDYFSPAQLGIAAAVRSGVITQDQATPMLMSMIQNKDGIPDMLKGVAAQSTVKRNIVFGKPGEVGFENGVAVPGMAVPEKPEKPTEASIAMDLASTDPAKRAAAQTAMNALKPPRSTTFEQKAVLLDGKPSIVNFDPSKGTHTLANGEDVSARVKPIPPAATVVNAGQASEAKDVADAIMRGEQPPDMKSLYRMAGPIKAELARSGYNLTNATLDWEATKKHVLALNSAQQLKLNQSVNALPELLDSVDALASQWKGGQFPILNKANLTAAKNGGYGDDVAAVARKLDQQIADVNSDLGAVYMGGNSPTDHALKLASTALSGDWSEKVLHEMVSQARSNVNIRQNSMRNTGVAGASADNPYAAKPTTQPAIPAGAPQWIRDSSGKLVLK